MALELTFSKPDTSTNWGFRLVGGSDFDQPLVVVKVNEDSLAEDSGLQVGDVIVRVNNTSTAGLTHTDVHKLITSSGPHFALTVRRGDSPINIIHDGDYDFEFQEIVKGVQRSVDEDIIDEASDIVKRLNRENSRRNQESLSINKNSIRQEKMFFSNTAQTDFMEEETCGDKKWSTFLMKPDKPIPQPKRTIEEIQMKDNPYKVVIKKQGSRRKSFSKEKKVVQFDQTITQLEPETQTADTDEETEEANDGHEEYSEEHNGNVNILDDEENDIGNEIKDENENVTNNGEYVDFETINEEPVEIRYKSLSEIRVDESESSMTLEEQLLAVQKQLQALSQLPSAIQMTLDAVSKQLASIVSAKENSQDREAEQRAEREEENEASISVEAEAEAEMTHAGDEDTNSSMGDELDDDYMAEEEIKAILDRARVEEEEVEEEVEEEEEEKVLENGLTEEEKEAIMREEQLEAKKEKGMQDPQIRPKPIQRPIILPGGRKWSNPEDAMPRFRKPKMSEEKIFETIENNLETIVGKRKGLTIGTTSGLGQTESNQSTDLPILNREKVTTTGPYRIISVDSDVNCTIKRGKNEIKDESNDTPLQSPAPSTENLHISRPLSAASDNTTSVSVCSSITPRGTKKRVRNKADEVLDKVNARLNVNEDNFDVFGKSVAHKLRNLSPEAALLADKFISDILFEAALGNITRHTKMSLINDIRQHVQPEQASQHAIPRQHHQSANNVPNTSAYGYLSNQNDVDFSEQANTATYYTQFSSDLLELN